MSAQAQPVGSAFPALRVSPSAFAGFVWSSAFVSPFGFVRSVSSLGSGGVLFEMLPSFSCARGLVLAARALGLPARVVVWARPLGLPDGPRLLSRVAVLVGPPPSPCFPAPAGSFVPVWGCR